VVFRFFRGKDTGLSGNAWNPLSFADGKAWHGGWKSMVWRMEKHGMEDGKAWFGGWKSMAWRMEKHGMEDGKAWHGG